MNKIKEVIGYILVGTLLLMFGIGLIFVLGSVRLSGLRPSTHTGYVTAVDQRGFFVKNYEIYFKTDNSSSQEDIYCIHEYDKELAEQARDLSKSRKLVTIEYEGVRGFGWGLCNYSQIKNIIVEN